MYIFIIHLEIKFLMIYSSRYIKTSGNATVDHLSKYLAVRLALEELRSKGESNQMNLDTASEKQYTIYIATASGQFTVSIENERLTLTIWEWHMLGLGPNKIVPGHDPETLRELMIWYFFVFFMNEFILRFFF